LKRTTFPIKDREGHLKAYHVRYDYPDGDKDHFWQQSDGKSWGLNGTPVTALPLYGSEEVDDWPEEAGVVIVEGEKAKDALTVAGIRALGTVTGAASTPDLDPLKVVEGHPVCLWPDNDPEGRAHMKRVAERLQGIANVVRWFEWPGAPEKGDAADHPALRDAGDLTSLRRQLAAARVWEASGEDVPTSGNVLGDTKHHGGRELSDLGNAERFVDRYGQRVRWCPSMKSHLLWDGKRWAKDDCDEVVKLAQETARSIHHEAANTDDTDKQRRLARWAISSQSAARITAMISQAQPHLAVRLEALDADRWLLNCENGTIDLRTGEVRDHDPEDLITKLVPVAFDRGASAPRFRRFLEETLVHGDVIAFVQRFAGYSLTGDTRERALAILWGSGKNGKSTLVELLTEVIGDYAQGTDVETVLMKRHGGVGNDVAALKGARFVSCSEVEKGRRLAESKVKQLTGRDTVTARFLFCEPFNFKPEFKLWMSTNNKPEIRGTDDAIWDRLRLIPFTQRFEGSASDPKLPEKLREELPGVLAWLVDGCLDWQEHGLGEPKQVAEATAEYRSEMDSLAAFIEECCVVHKDATAPFRDLYDRYSEWSEKSGEIAEKKRAFGTLLTDRGFLPGNGSGNVAIRLGIGLRTDREPPPDGPGGGLDVNSGDDQVNYKDVTKDTNKPDNTNPRLTNTPGVNDELISLTPKNPCKTGENAARVNQVNVKTTTSETKPPRVKRMGKHVNYSNSLTQTDTEDDLWRPLEPEEYEAVRFLTNNGVSEKWARLEVLGEEGAA
jgi:P4 family phage/plasmid primase-like protien